MTSVINETPAKIDDVIYGISSIFKMFKLIGQPQFPRNIMTATSNGFYQVPDIETLYADFKTAGFVDCRISAYPPINQEDEVSVIPNISLLDFDYDNEVVKEQGIQAADEQSKSKVNTILQNLYDRYGISNCMVMYTGNGRHVLVPFMFDVPLEQIEEFRRYIPLLLTYNRRNENNVISEKFLVFAKKYLSMNQADLGNFPNLKSIMIRCPGTINSKQKFNDKCNIVKIEHEWAYDTELIPKLEDMYNPEDSNCLINEFLHHMNITVGNQKSNLSNNKIFSKSKQKIKWIEILHKTALADCRKRLIWLVMCPYAVNIREMQNDAAFLWIKRWTDKCNIVRELDFDVDRVIETYLEKAEVGGFKPIAFKNLDKYEFTTSAGVGLFKYLDNKMHRYA